MINNLEITMGLFDLPSSIVTLLIRIFCDQSYQVRADPMFAINWKCYTRIHQSP
jgi:hypothetical protein